MPGEREWAWNGERGNIPNNILRASRVLRIIILGHVSTAAATSGVDMALDGGRFEGDGIVV